MPGFSGQGLVDIAPVANGAPGAFAWMGNCPKFSVALDETLLERSESFTGNRLPLRRVSAAKAAKVTLTFDEWSADNLKRALYATATAVAGGTPVAGEVQPTGLVAGSVIILAGQNVSAVTVKDSSGSPKTLPAGQYALDAFAGRIVLNDITTGGPYVQPFKVDYTPGAVNLLAFFNTAAPEYWLRLTGTNTDGGGRALVNLYRVRFSPIKELPLIQDDLAEFSLEGSALVDATKPAGGALGQIGSIVLP